jgi:hypothetical protein
MTDPIGTVRKLGNSYFIRLVEPTSEPWHVMWSEGPQNVSGWQDDETMAAAEKVGYAPILDCVPGASAEFTTEWGLRIDGHDKPRGCTEHSAWLAAPDETPMSRLVGPWTPATPNPPQTQQFPPGEDAEAFKAHGNHDGTPRKDCMYCEDLS